MSSNTNIIEDNINTLINDFSSGKYIPQKKRSRIAFCLYKVIIAFPSKLLCCCCNYIRHYRENNTPLHECVINGNFELFQKRILQLIETLKKKNTTDKKKHLEDKKNGNNDIQNYINTTMTDLLNSYTPCRGGCTLLSLAVQMQDVNVVKYLLSSSTLKECIKIDINKVDRESPCYSVLHHAILIDHREILDLLLNYHDNHHHHDNDEQIPMMNINITDDTGMTPLMLACEVSRLEIIQLLMETYQAEYSKVDYERGWSCLFYASARGDKDIVEYLLNEGVDRFCMDVNKELAVDWACRNGHDDVVRCLEEFKGKRMKLKTAKKRIIAES